MKYKVLVDDCADRLLSGVNSYLGVGWKISGSVAIAVDAEGIFLAQAMTHESDNPPHPKNKYPD